MGSRIPTAEGAEAVVAQALNARIDKLRRLLIPGPISNQLYLSRARPAPGRALDLASNVASIEKRIASSRLPRSLASGYRNESGINQIIATVFCK